MGNSTSRVVGCFAPFNGKNGGGGGDLDFFEPLDEGLGHSFCYVRPMMLDSPAITPFNSERFTVDSSTLDSETLSGSFRHDSIEDNPMYLQNRPNKCFPETSFRTISGASVSANVSTVRTGNQSVLFGTDAQEPAASFESTSSFNAIPLQPIPRGSGPLNGFISGPLERGFASGPLERGFASGPLEKGGGFMSGPIEKGVMSGPLDITDKSTFSAPLAHGRRRPGLQNLMRSVSGPLKSTLSRTFSKHSMGSRWMQRFFLHPMTRSAWHSKEPKVGRGEVSQNYDNNEQPEGEYTKTCNLQWAHGKAGEDRVHVVLSEEQGWLFIGIYDGFSGPDAPEFLMSHLYRAIDKEMEGLLWEYDNKTVDDKPNPEISVKEDSAVDSEPCKEDQPSSHSSKVISHSLEESSNHAIIQIPSSNNQVAAELKEINECFESESPTCGTLGRDPTSDPATKLGGLGKKSMRLFELLQMEAWDEQGSLSISEVDDQIKENLSSREIMQEENKRSFKEERNNFQNEDPTTSGEDRGDRVAPDVQCSGQIKVIRKSQISSKIRKMYKKQKSLRKKLFRWNYDWHREDTCLDERIAKSPGVMRRCKSGVIDNNAVLRAMARALETTEEAYMEMVIQALDKNPELALMGSCVLVMLMKDQDVYVMNLGDSRVILAQERPNDRYLNTSILKDDFRHHNRSRETLVHMELDRISEESPMHNQNSQANKMNKIREISVCRLKMRAVQLSTDHGTNIEEEVLRIKAEHLDDAQAVFNDRVKGQLKVTRAFGAGFLKEPRCNEALLEMFQVDYVGTSPYVSCIPSISHHRLSSSDRFLILSSDGLYQYFSNEEVVAHVTWFIENVPEGDPAQYLIAELLFRAAKKNGMDFHELLDIPNGDRRKYHDDVSVMVVSLEGRIWRSSG